jgi:hypothetical protein
MKEKININLEINQKKNRLNKAIFISEFDSFFFHVF